MQLYGNTFENVQKINDFLTEYKLAKLIQE